VTLESDTICEGDCIDLMAEASSGTEPYLFEWSEGIDDSDSVVNVCPFVSTTYQVIVFDALGDSDTTTATVTVLSPPTINLGADTILCVGTILELDAENPGATYLWQDGSEDQTFMVSEPGVYWVEVNNEGCVTVDSIEVSYVGPELDLGADTSLCLIEDFILNAENPGATYLWQDGSTDQLLTVLDTGLFYVTVSDEATGCVVSDTMIVSSGILAVDLGEDTILCASEDLLLDAGNPGADYLWSDGSTDQTLLVETDGLYSVTVEQGVCINSDSILVQFQFIVPDFTVDNFQGCAPEEIVFTDLTTSSGEIAEWSWNFGDGGTSSFKNPSHLYDESGTYNVSLEVTTVEGCSATKDLNVSIEIFTTPLAAFSLEPEIPEINELVTFTDESINAETWFWNFGDGATSSLQNPTHYYTDRGIFNVKLIVQNEICYDTAQFTIIIEEPIIFYVPNVFTPDGDNFNEVFQPVFSSGFDPFDFHLTIFNRWGEIVFESYDATIGWDGTYGDNGIVQDGVYVWKIDFGDINSDKKYSYSGHVTLLK
jgi:gliding motility-associated-like protein